MKRGSEAAAAGQRLGNPAVRQQGAVNDAINAQNADALPGVTNHPRAQHDLAPGVAGVGGVCHVAGHQFSCTGIRRQPGQCVIQAGGNAHLSALPFDIRGFLQHLINGLNDLGV